MDSYLKFFELRKSPFDAEGSRGVVLGTKALRKAFQEIQQGLDHEAPRICVGGKQGLGKTSLCRALPKLLGDTARVIQIMNPHRPWQEIRTLIVRKLMLEGATLSRKSLLTARREHRYLVLAIDQAELLSREALDHIDTMLRYQDDDNRQLVHCVLFANLEAAPAGADVPLLWWLDSLTTLQLRFAPIPAQGIHHYIEKRLKKAGWAGGDLFSPQACLAIHRFTGGVPSAVNVLCEKALSEASFRGLAAIGSELVEELSEDTDAETIPPFDKLSFENSAFGNAAFEDKSPSMTATGESGLSAQSLLDASPIMSTEHERSAVDHSPFELTNDPFVTPPESTPAASVELTNDPFVTPSEATPRSSLELADDPGFARLDTQGPAGISSRALRPQSDHSTRERSREATRSGAHRYTRLLLGLLLAVVAGAAVLQMKGQLYPAATLALETALESTLETAQAPEPSQPSATSSAKPGSVAAVLDAIDEAPAPAPEDLGILPLANGEAEATLEENAALEASAATPERTMMELGASDDRIVVELEAVPSEEIQRVAPAQEQPAPVQPRQVQPTIVSGSAPSETVATREPVVQASVPVPSEIPSILGDGSTSQPVVNEHLALPSASELKVEPVAAPDPAPRTVPAAD